MSSPATIHSDMDTSQQNGNPFTDIPTRPMRVKVLYTFDDDNKTNCLARFPDILNIPTVPIDESTQIGVIELKTCIRAIVNASPELISRLTQGDFTIYAYDYSEYETPLVGQGMLSSVLAAASPTPAAPAHQSKTMITGRVCKNIMGLFSNGVKETLEVKLRLVPVPKPVQQDFLRNMEVYRNLSPAMSAGFDPNAWSASLQQQVPFALGTPFEEAPTPGSVAVDMSFDGQNMMAFQRPRGMSSATTMPGQGIACSAPPSRVNSPALSVQQHYQHEPRPSSRTSVRSERPSTRRRESVQFNDQGQEDGPPKKRVKVTQTDWRGKSAFGPPSDSLRVTASTAASIRIHKPVPTRPGMPSAHNNSLEPPPRAPTPVPQLNLPNNNNTNANRMSQGSLLRRESSLVRAQSYNSPYAPPQDMPTHSDAAMSSPEDNDNACDVSPLDFPSSPPQMPDPSSPGLPSFQRPADSGYMSSALECPEDDDEDRSVCEEDMRMAAQYKPRGQVPFSDFIEQTPGPPELLPTRMQQHASQAQEALAAELSRKNARSAIVTQKTVVPKKEKSRRGSVAVTGRFPAPQGQDNASVSSRSMSYVPRSEAASPAPNDDAFPKLPRSGSGAKRKKTIQDQLLKSIENGEMPTFCGHCGAIETPTWRNLWTKTVHGNPKELAPEADGVTQGTEVLERKPDTNEAIKYRIIKSVRKNKDTETQGFDPLLVCNPCGLWFNKFQAMRPPEKWVKKASARRKQQRKVPPPAGPMDPQSDYFCDQPCALYTDAVQPEEDTAQQSSRELSNEGSEEAHTVPADRPRAASLEPQHSKSGAQGQWTGAQLDAALHRAIQSSPARFGTQESPIELDTEHSPKPTRRLLFPSPRKAGEVKSLDDIALPGSVQKYHTFIETAFVEEATANKENMPPGMDEHGDLAHLFECSPNIFKTPRKTTPNKNKLRDAFTSPTMSHHFDTLLKTPTPSRSSARLAAKRNITPHNPKDSAFLPTFTSAEAKNLSVPTTPSRFANLSSPGRDHMMTPFTRQLTQLLSDAGYNPDDDVNGAAAAAAAASLAAFSSPGKGGAFDFGCSLPTFMTPGRNLDFSGFDFGIAADDAGEHSHGQGGVFGHEEFARQNTGPEVMGGQGGDASASTPADAVGAGRAATATNTTTNDA